MTLKSLLENFPNQPQESFVLFPHNNKNLELKLNCKYLKFRSFKEKLAEYKNSIPESQFICSDS